MSAPDRLGMAGRLAQAFQLNALTPLLAIVAMLLGLFAVLVTPREEEPQINVTMANVLIAFPGASSADVQNMVARPAEQVLGQIAGIEHTYSVARPGVAVITVQFKVGVPRTEALVRLYDVLNANSDWLPHARAIALSYLDGDLEGFMALLDDPAAVATYERVLAVAPGSVEAASAIQAIHERNGDWPALVGALNGYVLTQFNSASLHRHISQTYRFDVFRGGFVHVLAAEQNLTNRDWYQGTADAVRQVMMHIEDFAPRDVLILSGDHLYQMDYSKFLAHHHQEDADVTVSVNAMPRSPRYSRTQVSRARTWKCRSCTLPDA